MIGNSRKKNHFSFSGDGPPPATAPAAALYVHVPFCRAKCRYCDFYSHPADEETLDAYVSAARTELALREASLAPSLQSVYFGGGTPTLLGPKRLARLLEAIRPRTTDETEITVETNPGVLDAATVSAMRDGGVNRVSLGAQSFDDGELTTLGRQHRAEDIGRAVEILRAAGMENLSLDLIYAIPGQSRFSWRRSLQAAVDLAPQHVSCYALSFEEGTALEADRLAGRVEETDEQTQRDRFEEAVEFLGAAGFEQYELSNFARPGRRCRQNLTYWQNHPYLGLGPAACSYLGGVRRTHSADTAAYLRALHSDPPHPPPPSWEERLTGRKAMAETLMLALRLIEGVEISAFQQRFGCAPTEAFPHTFRRYLSQGAVVATPTHLRLHRDSLFTSNCILADLLAEAE